MRKPGSMIGGGLILSFIGMSCAVSDPKFQPEDVFTGPGTTRDSLRSVVVYVDLKDLPREWREPAIVGAVEDGFRTRGFDVVDHNAYMSFLKERGLSPSESAKAGLLSVVRDKLGRSALVRVHVDVFMVQGRRIDPLKTVTPGVPGSRSDGGNPVDVALKDGTEMVIDLSLTFEMFDTETAELAWSCAFKRFQVAYEGRIQGFFKRVVDACLSALPAAQSVPPQRS